MLSAYLVGVIASACGVGILSWKNYKLEKRLEENRYDYERSTISIEKSRDFWKTQSNNESESLRAKERELARIKRHLEIEVFIRKTWINIMEYERRFGKSAYTIEWRDFYHKLRMDWVRNKNTNIFYNFEDLENEINRANYKKRDKQEVPREKKNVGGTSKWLKMLGLSGHVTDINVIKRQYKKLMMIYHPDRPTGNQRRAQDLNEAYHELEKIFA